MLNSAELYWQFDGRPESEYSSKDDVSLLGYKSWDVNVDGLPWSVVDVNGYATVSLTDQHKPIGTTLVGSCIPIVIDWTAPSHGRFVTVIHQAGFREYNDIPINRFEPLDIFLSQLPDSAQIRSAHVIRIKGVHPQPSNAEDILSKLKSALTERMSGLKHVEDTILPKAFAPYFDLQFKNREITAFAREKSSLSKKIFSIV